MSKFAVEGPVALDTNIFVYVFDEDSDFHLQAKKVMNAIRTQNLKVVVSVIVYSELFSYPPISKAEHQQYAKILENNAQFQLLGVTLSIAKTAAYLRRKYRIKTPDALIIASAIESGAEVFITHDERLKIIEEIEVQSLANLTS